MSHDSNRLADLIAGRCRVRVGEVEGILDGFTSRAMWLIVDGKRVEVPRGAVEPLEPLDEAAVAAHWAALTDADEQLQRGYAKTVASEALRALNVGELREVLTDALAQLGPPATKPKGAPR